MSELKVSVRCEFCGGHHIGTGPDETTAHWNAISIRKTCESMHPLATDEQLRAVAAGVERNLKGAEQCG